MEERNLILDYDIIYGLPGDVKQRVKNLINRVQGWQPHGEPQVMDLQGTEIVIQGMVKYEQR